MKKFVLFFVLILGFISEVKAQFPASSEIYYYVSIEEGGSDRWVSVHSFKFEEGRVLMAYNYIDDLEDLRPDFTSGAIYYYDKRTSNEKYVVYWRKTGNLDDYYAFSKNKEELIHFFRPNWVGDSHYYFKRVTLKDLESILKPKFDFLE